MRATADALTYASATDAQAGETGPFRRCLASGEVRPKTELVRFVVGPDARIVPDIAQRLPGRGLWLTARRDIVALAVKKRLFARAARASVLVEDDLARRLEELLARRAVDLIGLARRAGLAVQGSAKVRAALAAKTPRVLIAASDGAADGRAKLRALAPALPLVEALSSVELGAAFGRDRVVHAVLKHGALAERFLIDIGRLRGFRAPPTNELSEGNVTGAR